MEEGKSIWDAFPNLQSLTLRGWGWNARLPDMVLRCLQEKVDTGMKLPRLEIDRSMLGGADLERLKGLVGDVCVAEGLNLTL